MTPAVARLLRRLASAAVGVSVMSPPQAHAALVPSVGDKPDQDQFKRLETIKTRKLVFGTQRRGWAQLAAHGSHSSHSSHSSHYSGASGGYYSPTVPVTPTPAPAAPALPAAKVQPADSAAILDQVLKKLPKVRSHWPKTTHVVRAAKFNLVDGTDIIGVIELNAGAKVTLVEIKPEHAIIAYTGLESPLPVPNTDIIEQMGGPEKILALPDDPIAAPAVKPGTDSKAKSG